MIRTLPKPTLASESVPTEMRSALFAQMVMQQSNMAMMLLGKTRPSRDRQIVRDLEAAKLFIDQLEMLEAKTKGNLSQEEAALLKQSLMSLRMAFVESGGCRAETGRKPVRDRRHRRQEPLHRRNSAEPVAAPGPCG